MIKFEFYFDIRSKNKNRSKKNKKFHFRKIVDFKGLIM